MYFLVLRRLNVPLLLVCAIFSLANPAPTPPEPNVAAESWTNHISGQPSRKALSRQWEEARQIWNGLRTAKKHYAATRERRATGGDPTPPPLLDHNELNNLSIPPYMKELYWNLSKHDSENTDTTTIRSLPGLRTGNGCGFNFSVGDISDHEVFMRAELRIHMRQPDGSDYQPIYLQLYHGQHKGTYKTVTPSREGWIVFDVLSHIQQWRASNHRHRKKNIHFHVLIYTSLDELTKRENGKNCHDSTIQFDQAAINGTNTGDFQPLLMIYSHDLDVIKFNLSAIEAAETESNDVHRRDTDGNTEARPTQPTMGRCGMHTLQINLTTFNHIWHLAQTSQTALYPRTFNINVCGGSCDRNLPLFAPAQHSIIMYYLHRRSHPTPFGNATWGQCCAPVKYQSIETLFSLPEGEVRIVTLRDISVKRCSCLTILRTQTTSR